MPYAIKEEFEDIDNSEDDLEEIQVEEFKKTKRKREVKATRKARDKVKIKTIPMKDEPSTVVEVIDE